MKGSGAVVNVEMGGQFHMGFEFAAWYNAVGAELGDLFKDNNAVKEFMVGCKFDWISAYLSGMMPDEAARRVVQ